MEIRYKTKVQKTHDGREYVAVPQLSRHHCVMNGWRNCKTYGGLANSDLFPSVLKRVRKDILQGGIGLFLGEDRSDDIRVVIVPDRRRFFAQVALYYPDRKPNVG